MIFQIFPALKAPLMGCGRFLRSSALNGVTSRSILGFLGSLELEAEYLFDTAKTKTGQRFNLQPAVLVVVAEGFEPPTHCL